VYDTKVIDEPVTVVDDYGAKYYTAVKKSLVSSRALAIVYMGESCLRIPIVGTRKFALFSLKEIHLDG
jgi:hypothetical protein